jgi:hypothetical protein
MFNVECRIKYNFDIRNSSVQYSILQKRIVALQRNEHKRDE